jgi:CheY-specific phosphatase CheX
MPARFLGQFLLERGSVTRDGLVAAVDYQDQRNPKLGELAVREKMLKPADAERINQEQRRTDAQFGQVATKLNLLNERQVEQLIAKQKRERVLIGQALIAVGAITPGALEREMRVFEQEEIREREEIRRAKESMPWATAPIYAVSVLLTSKLLLRVAGLQVKEGAARGMSDELPPADVRVGIPFSGGWKGDLVLSMSNALATQICVKMAGEENPPVDLIVDSVGEFANVVCGQICASLQRDNLSCELHAPEKHRRGSSARYANRQIAAFDLESPQGILQIALIPS